MWGNLNSNSNNFFLNSRARLGIISKIGQTGNRAARIVIDRKVKKIRNFASMLKG